MFGLPESVVITSRSLDAIFFTNEKFDNFFRNINSDLNENYNDGKFLKHKLFTPFEDNELSNGAILNDSVQNKYSLAEMITESGIFGTSNVFEIEICNSYLLEKEKKIFAI